MIADQPSIGSSLFFALAETRQPNADCRFFPPNAECWLL